MIDAHMPINVKVDDYRRIGSGGEAGMFQR